MIEIEDIVGDAVIPAGPPPPAELGRNILSIQDARTWLNHPSNWRDMTTFIIKWDGPVPYINRRHGLRLIEEPWDTGIYQIVIRHQRFLKQGGREPSQESPE